ncbi:MAG: hypothetical protein AB8F94_21665 [Saprospiraceae bacterium]
MPIPDEFHHLIQKLIDQHQPKNQEELQKILDSVIGQSVDNLKITPETDEEKARELVYKAYNLPKDKGRRRALKAIKIFPDCIEAYEYLGSTYSYYHKSAEYFAKGVEVGRRIFGGDFLKKNKGHFYGITETRPFMRCLGNLAECYYSPGQTPKAIEIWKEMLELNQNDNQGVRYNLASGLLEKKMFKGFEKLLNQYNDDGSIMFYFPRALYKFIQLGDCDESRFALSNAKTGNKYVIPMLLKTYPPEEYVDSYMMGSREEAISYLHFGWRSWGWATDDAKSWLRKNR